MKIGTFFYTIGQGFKNLFRNKGYTLASIATISACLFLFGMFFSVLTNFRHMVLKAEEGVSVTAFFNEDQGVTEEQILQLKVAIEEREEVASVEYITADEAWETFSEEYLGEYKEGFLENPLEGDDHLVIYLADVAQQSELVDYLENLDIVREVNRSETVADMLSGANQLIFYASIAIIAVLLVVSLFLISNTIASGITSHQDEITIMKYIGATDFYVRAPYVFEGLIIGVLGSVIPLAFTHHVYVRAIEVIVGRFAMLAGLLDFIPVDTIFYYLIPVSIAMGVGLGFIGSILSVRKHLRV